MALPSNTTQLSHILLLLFLANYFPRQGLAPLDTICLLSAGMAKSLNLTYWTSSQKLGRHASLRVRSVWKKLGPGKLQVKEVWAQIFFIDFLAELVNSFLLKFVWADHPSPPPLTHTPDQFQEILPRPKMFSLIFSLNWIVKKKLPTSPPTPPRPISGILPSPKMKYRMEI